MFDLPPFDNIFWKLPSFIFFAACAALCLIYRCGHPRLARWGLLLFIAAAAVRLFELLWFNSSVRQAEQSGLWTEETLDRIDLLLDFARLIPTAVAIAFMVSVVNLARRTEKVANEL